jgi:hypothetical protein
MAADLITLKTTPTLHMKSKAFSAGLGSPALRQARMPAATLRAQAVRLRGQQQEISAFDKCSHLAGSIKGKMRGAKGNDYLRQFSR